MAEPFRTVLLIAAGVSLVTSLASLVFPLNPKWHSGCQAISLCSWFMALFFVLTYAIVTGKSLEP